MNQLKELMISVTNNCNLRCKMCDIPHSFKKDMLLTDDFKQLFKDFSEIGLHKKEVVLSGGEPLMRKDIFDIISYASSLGIFTYMPSNGTLITRSVAKRLRDAGVDTVNISIEGPREVHDNIRGIGTFDKSINAIEYLLENNTNITIATTVMKQNYTHLPEILELAKNLGVATVMFQPFSKKFLLGSKKEDFWINNSEELSGCIDQVIHLSDKYSIMINHEKYLKKIPAYFLNFYHPNNKHCSIIKTSCSINHNGNVYPCWPRDKIILGNIKKEGISQIWDSSQHKSIIKTIKSNKCPNTCLMSCHEKNFGKLKLLDPNFYNKLKKILKNKKLTKKEGVDADSLYELESVEQELEKRIRDL